MNGQDAKAFENIFYLGTFGSPPVISCYLVEGSKLALIESGPRSVVKGLVEAIKSLGFDLVDVSYIITSHVHLDHAGGAGSLVKMMPQAKVLAYELGVKHMIDPSRLISSASQVLGDVFDLWGPPEPVPTERILAIRDGDSLDLGGPFLRFIATPGHAPHEMAIFEEKSRCVFTGDTVGVYHSHLQTITPASPPPSFNYPEALRSIRRLVELHPSSLMLPHYGYWRNSQEMLQLNLRVYRHWAEVLKELVAAGKGVDEALVELVKHYPEYRALLESSYDLKMLRMDIDGFMTYFEEKLSAKTS